MRPTEGAVRTEAGRGRCYACPGAQAHSWPRVRRVRGSRSSVEAGEPLGAGGGRGRAHEGRRAAEATGWSGCVKLRESLALRGLC